MGKDRGEANHCCYVDEYGSVWICKFAMPVFCDK